MSTYINRAAFSKTRFRSSNISVLSYTLHHFTNKGMYLGKIYQGKTLIDTFQLACTENCKHTQVNIDLAALGPGRISSSSGKTYQIAEKGFVLFYDSREDKGYRVRIEKASRTKKSKIEFDTKTLKDGDVYAITLLRPGEYQVTNSKNKSSMKVSVPFPDKNKDPREVIPPVQVSVEDKGFSGKAVSLTPGQGLVFVIDTPTHLDINLVKATEPKATKTEKLYQRAKPKKVSRRYTWRNPKKQTS